ncbi:squamosa promoter-binding-like protein 1 isoform X2 [Daucus carota subsp. sativus]|uniref:squamosa promoter-binding-like protein 1 isoform X2 n=1 Tax=Daucus carota subsp. sativus TaxID=79200 RepID=UPI003083B45C
MKAIRKNMEWDLNDWKWDGDQFTAAPLRSVAADCRSRQFFPIGPEIPVVTGLSNSSSSCSEEIDLRNEREQRELEKRRRVFVVDDDELDDESGSLNLNLGGMVYPVANGEVENWNGKSGKKTKLGGSASSGAVCQVDDCRADLSSAKDYHRRHKVCAVHSKATKAMVGSAMQRFCQQCSRFHLLQEFDEGKRSCRRRLAGHNKRRRKTHPENSNTGVPVNDELSNSYLLISLLRILSNMHTDSSDQMKDQDLLSHLLKNLASVAGTINEGNLSGLLNGSSKLQLQNFVASRGQQLSRPTGQCTVMPSSGMTQKREFVDNVSGGKFQTPPAQLSNIHFPTKDCIAANANASNAKMESTKELNFDLNDVYDDSEECMEPLERSDAPICVENGSAGYPIWIHQDSDKSSPPQTSGNSGSLSTQSPSSSSGEAQVRTDRIVFKLFGKNPSEFPLVLRSQILGWLAHSPTDIESYIRPGCVILTIYLRMEKSTWEVVCSDLSFSLRKLLDSDSFWKEGWIYTRVQNRVAFVHDGEVVLDTQLTVTNDKNCNISSIRPIAVTVSENANFLVKGSNMSQSTRILCALEGMYLVQQSCSELMDGCGSLSESDKGQSLSFPCSIPNVMGRGFIEVEDQTLGTSFFPFIVAEKDVCSEICTLESALELAETTSGIKGETEHLEVHDQALEFVHEMGWLLHRTQLKIRLGPNDPNLDLFSFKRFRYLMEFSLDHDWCAVVKKLLCILFSGIVDSGEHPNIERALLDIGLLHRAVQRNCRPMVQALLSFIPANVIDKYGPEQTLPGHIFRPDSAGPGGLTPLHIAASSGGYETVLDALTDDPQMVGLEAWKNARDGAGLTPHDYAFQRGCHSYINMIQKKTKTRSGQGHVVVDIPGTIKQKLPGGPKPTEVSSFQTEKAIMKLVQSNCNLCEQKLAYGNYRRSLASYRPAMLAMVAIAAVCVCVALLFKSSPEVLYVFQPFRWEHLKFGSS